MIAVARTFMVLAILSGCVGTATLPQKVACVDDSSCLTGEMCEAGNCVRASALTEQSCASDLDCNVAAGEFCAGGNCAAPPDEAPESCTETAQCPLDTFCNVASGQCDPLLSDWCRIDAHCPGALCSTATSTRTGTCVECRSDADCGGLACQSDGTCEEPPPAPVECPPNSTLVPGSTTICQCDPGFLPDPASQTCEPEPAEPGGDTTTCVPNASPVPGVPGQCRCDGGFEPNTDGSACVPIDDQPPPPPPPDGGDGGNGGNVDDDDECGPNSFPLFFVCVCYPGFVVNEFGDGCVEEGSSNTSDGCPPNSYDGNDGYCYCDPGFVVDASGTQCVPASNNTSSQCPPNSTLYSDGYCYCNAGFAPNSSGTACEVDQCAQAGYYGDGFYCDDFCPYYDPDCG